MFEGIEHLKSEHARLKDAFERLCQAHGWSFSYEHLADKELYFSRTILDCTIADRQLYVNLTEQRETPSAYIKMVGWKFEIQRLVANVEKVDGNIDRLWTIYSMWLVDRADEREVDRFLEQAFD
jgi:hypothetical protein